MVVPQTPVESAERRVRLLMHVQAAACGLDGSEGLHVEDYDPAATALGRPGAVWLTSLKDGDSRRVGFEGDLLDGGEAALESHWSQDGLSSPHPAFLRALSDLAAERLRLRREDAGAKDRMLLALDSFRARLAARLPQGRGWAAVRARLRSMRGWPPTVVLLSSPSASFHERLEAEILAS